MDNNIKASAELHTYRKLTVDELKELCSNELVFINRPTNCGTPPYDNHPALTIKTASSAVFCAALVEDDTFPLLRSAHFDYETYDVDWWVNVRTSMLVNTPDGVIRVFDKCDDEYPGHWTEFVREDGTTITLALTEYIPGGEGVCGYNPANPDEMARERAEVPVERLQHADGDPIECRPEEYADSELVVSAGFVTRAWPNEQADMDAHNRTFHYGYKKPRTFHYGCEKTNAE